MDELNYRAGDEAQNCGLCQNFDSTTKQCSVLGTTVAPEGLCDAFSPVEAEGELDLMKMLFGG